MKKPTDTQRHILRRMAWSRWNIVASEWLCDPRGASRKRVNARTLNALVENGWIERFGANSCYSVSDAGRKAAE